MTAQVKLHNNVRCCWTTVRSSPRGSRLCNRFGDYVVITPSKGIDAALNNDELFCLTHARKAFWYAIDGGTMDAGEIVAIIKLTLVAKHKNAIE